MFEPRLDSGTVKEDVRTTTRYRHSGDNDLSQEPSYIVKHYDDKKQEEDVDFISEVEFKFNSEDNWKVDVQVMRRGPRERSGEEEEMHGGTEDSDAAVQPPCTTRKISKIAKQIKLPSTEAQRLQMQQFLPPTHSCEDSSKKFFCTAPMGNKH